jgi:hypothetical protein
MRRQRAFSCQFQRDGGIDESALNASSYFMFDTRCVGRRYAKNSSQTTSTDRYCYAERQRTGVRRVKRRREAKQLCRQ